jgi:hypothetical protein
MLILKSSPKWRAFFIIKQILALRITKSAEGATLPYHPPTADDKKRTYFPKSAVGATYKLNSIYLFQ